jgi:two-component system, NtrC family, response regulator PilR
MEKKRQILGDSPPVKQLLNMISKVAGNKTNVLVVGESGTGKELVARMIHDSGPMKGKPFIPVNCGAIPENLIESEMFGHKKGSFTGATSDKPGLFEAANGGTLFLDEVGELPLSMQVKLLRSIQERIIRRVGSNDDIRVDVRIISATNRDLEAMIREGRFREDLFYRLNVILIRTPPLRERAQDIPLLATEFLRRFSERQGKPIRGFSDEAVARLVSYAWPGNIRELENVIERAVTLEAHEKVEVASFPQAIVNAKEMPGSAAKMVQSEPTENVAGAFKNIVASPDTPLTQGHISLPAPDFTKGSIQLDEILSAVERQYLEKALEYTGGVKKRAADLLGITFRSIRYRLAKLGMDNEDSGGGEP